MQRLEGLVTLGDNGVREYGLFLPERILYTNEGTWTMSLETGFGLSTHNRFRGKD